jgi:tripartite-type tricarboxylate transporter receptor subunit TctC
MTRKDGLLMDMNEAGTDRVLLKAALLVFVALLACAVPAAAQNYPEKPIRLIVAFPTGVSQILGLLLSDKLREPLGQPVVADFRGGAGGNLAAELAAKSPPDGHTLLLTSNSIAISPSLYKKLPYDTTRDFAPIALIATVPNIMVVHPSVPARSLQELARLAKSQPGKLNYGSGGVGSSNQLGCELFKSIAKVNIVHVPYKGASLALTAMLGGEVDIVMSTISATIPHIEAGRMRGLAVLSPERVPTLPKIPTSAEAGMPELVVITWYGLFAPAGTKQDVVTRVNADVNKVLRSPDAVSQLTKVGVDPKTMSPAEFGKFVREEIDRWARVIKAADIRAD